MLGVRTGVKRWIWRDRLNHSLACHRLSSLRSLNRRQRWKAGCVINIFRVKFFNTSKGKPGIWTSDFPKSQLKFFLAFLASASSASRFYALGPFKHTYPNHLDIALPHIIFSSSWLLEHNVLLLNLYLVYPSISLTPQNKIFHPNKSLFGIQTHLKPCY